MQRSVTRDVEHRADVVERLLVEPAFAPRATHRVAIGSRLARPIPDVTAFVIIDQPLHRAGQVLHRLNVEHDHGRGHGEALEVAHERCRGATSEPAAGDDQPAGSDELALIECSHVLLGSCRHEREAKRKENPETGSSPHSLSPCCPIRFLWAVCGRAYTYVNAKVDKALDYYHKALALDPNYLLAREYLGEGYFG